MSIGSFTDPIVVDPDPSLWRPSRRPTGMPRRRQSTRTLTRSGTPREGTRLRSRRPPTSRGSRCWREITSSTRSPTRFIRLASSRRSRRRASGTCGRSQRRSRTPSSRGGPTVAWSSRRRAGATATARPSPHRSRTVVPDQRRSDAPRPLRRSRRGRGGGANPNAEPPSAVRRAPGPVRERGRGRDRATARRRQRSSRPRRGARPGVRRRCAPRRPRSRPAARLRGRRARELGDVHPDKTRPRRGRSPRDGVGVAAGGTPSPATRRTGCAGGRVVAGGGSRGASEKGVISSRRERCRSVVLRLDVRGEPLCHLDLLLELFRVHAVRSVTASMASRAEG